MLFVAWTPLKIAVFPTRHQNGDQRFAKELTYCDMITAYHLPRHDIDRRNDSSEDTEPKPRWF